MKFAAGPPEGPSLAEQAAGRSTADLVAARTDEAQRLMDAGMAVMVRRGTSSRATVAEIVREAGLSNQAFYRHFAGKDDLVAAIIDAGARRLVSYAGHRMEMFDDPLDQVRAWVQAVLSQGTDPKVAEPDPCAHLEPQRAGRRSRDLGPAGRVAGVGAARAAAGCARSSASEAGCLPDRSARLRRAHRGAVVGRADDQRLSSSSSPTSASARSRTRIERLGRWRTMRDATRTSGGADDDVSG